MKLFVALVLSYRLVVQVLAQERDFTEIIELSQELGPGRCDPEFSLENFRKGPRELRRTQREQDQNCYKLDSILNNADNIMGRIMYLSLLNKVNSENLLSWFGRQTSGHL